MLRVPLGVGFLLFDHDAAAAARASELRARGELPGDHPEALGEREREELAALDAALAAAGYVRHTATTRTRRTPE